MKSELENEQTCEFVVDRIYSTMVQAIYCGRPEVSMSFLATDEGRLFNMDKADYDAFVAYLKDQCGEDFCPWEVFKKAEAYYIKQAIALHCYLNDVEQLDEEDERKIADNVREQTPWSLITRNLAALLEARLEADGDLYKRGYRFIGKGGLLTLKVNNDYYLFFSTILHDTFTT